MADALLRVEAVSKAYAEMEGHIAALASQPGRADAQERLQEIVECPRPLAARLTATMGAVSPPARRLLPHSAARIAKSSVRAGFTFSH